MVKVLKHEDVLTITILCYTHGRPTMRNRNDSTRPPAKRGKVTPVRISGGKTNWRKK